MLNVSPIPTQFELWAPSTHGRTKYYARNMAWEEASCSSLSFDVRFSRVYNKTDCQRFVVRNTPTLV